MKRSMVVLLLALASLGFVQANRHPYRVLFDLTSRDSLDQRAVLRWIGEVATLSPNAEMEVVMYGRGFELVMPERSAYLAAVKEAMARPNVKFKVCAMSLRNNRRQCRRKPARCHPITISGFTIARTSVHRGHSCLSVVQKNRSKRVSGGLGRWRLSTAMCCRRARTSRDYPRDW